MYNLKNRLSKRWKVTIILCISHQSMRESKHGNQLTTGGQTSADLTGYTGCNIQMCQLDLSLLFRFPSSCLEKVAQESCELCFETCQPIPAKQNKNVQMKAIKKKLNLFCTTCWCQLAVVFQLATAAIRKAFSFH